MNLSRRTRPAGGYSDRLRSRIPLVVALTTTIFACAILGSALWSRFAANSQTLQLDGNGIRTSASEPQVALIDQEGRSFRLTDERGSEVVLFFGYAHCTDVCPITLAKLVRADRLLGREARKATVAFVTIDPQRDTVSALKQYVDRFDPHFYGLTGSEAALDSFYTAYHVWHQKLPNHGTSGGYKVAHSSAIYMLDKNGQLRVIHDWGDSPAVLAHDMRALQP